MASIEEVIQREINPFDPVTFKAGNFWQEDASSPSRVESIHQNAITEVETVIDQVAQDHWSRTILLTGDVGSGKSYFLGRLKQRLNSKAFFAYVGPRQNNDYIWRHTLRQMVDSFMHNPEGEEESQLILWLKSLSAFKDRSLIKKVLGERGIFVNNFRSTYPTGIYQAKEFFGALYDLTDPNLYFLACDWLRGEDLDREDLNALGIKNSISSEVAAQGIISNFGKISTSAQPIILCFDQVETSQLLDGSADIQPVFNVSTTFHNEHLKNFLIIISIVVHTWKQNLNRIQKSDRDRIEKIVTLKSITLEEAQALWESRLNPLHKQATPKPQSSIYPLKSQALEQYFPNGKTTPRSALTLGQNLYLKYKTGEEEEADIQTSFKLLWQKELNKTQKKISRVRQFSSLELSSMLQKVLSALQVREIQPKFLLSSTYSNHSFQFTDVRKNIIGVAWIEEPNMTSFFKAMESCQTVVLQNLCQTLYLIRAERIGSPNNKGHKIYQKIFKISAPHEHIVPDMDSVCILATYDRLLNSARSGELVISGETLKPQGFDELVRRSNVFENCSLLQKLKIVKGTVAPPPIQKAKEYMFDFIKVQHIISAMTAIQHTRISFPTLTDEQLKFLIQELCHEKKINIIDDKVSIEEQVICLIPEQKSIK